VFRNLWLKNETHRKWMPIYYLLFPVLVGQNVFCILKNRSQLLLLSSRDDQIFGTIAGVITGRKVIWIDHADMKGVTSQPFRFLKRSYYWSLRHASRVVAVSESEKKLIAKNLSSDLIKKFEVINNGAAKPNVQKGMERPPKSFVISYAGRIEKDKGIFDLIAAAKTVCDKHPNVVFWLAGKGSDEQAAKEEVERMGLSSRIIFLGHLDSVYSALLSSDLFVYPSHHDASPLAPVEALLAGVPVVATNIGGIPEVIDSSCGLMVEASQPAQLAGAVLRCVEDKKLLAFLAAGAREKARLLDFNYIVKERYLPLIQEALND
jgi:glycosyltransferase involved in cell wall biosynthesis